MLIRGALANVLVFTGSSYLSLFSSTSKMASIAMLIRGALANALVFTGSSYLFSRLSKDNIDKERKRYDLATEQLQKAQVEWAHKEQK